MLTFAEELILLLHDEDGGLLPIQKDAFDCALAGAVLMDLAFAGRIDTDPQALLVTDPAPTGDAVQDRVLARIAGGAEAGDTRLWIGTLSADEAPAMREQVLAGLAQRGIVARRGGWWPFRSRRRRSGGRVAPETVLRLRNALCSDDIPDPRDVALISLLDACDILLDIYPGREIARRRPRIAQLRKMDPIGREVAGAILNIQRSVALALRARSARLRRLLLLFSAGGALAAAATLLAPRIPIADSFGPTLFERLWFDTVWKQWSGYMLLGFSIAGLAAGLLPRLRALARRGGHNGWRLAHAVLGLCCLLLLFAHTGFRLGSDIEAALMGAYVVMLLCGALAGIAVNGASQLRKLGIGARMRAVPIGLHIAALCPLPALAIVHVLIVYLY